MGGIFTLTKNYYNDSDQTEKSGRYGQETGTGVLERYRQNCRQTGILVNWITSFVSGAGAGTLTPGLILGKDAL